MSGLWGEVLIVQFWISANSILEHICGTSGFADLAFFLHKTEAALYDNRKLCCILR